MKRKGEGSCLLKRGKPRSELPRCSISISEWSCSCAAATTLQGGTSKERSLWACSRARETLIFRAVWKAGDNLMFEESTKNKRRREREKRGLQKRGEKFQIYFFFRRTEFYKLFEAGMLNNSLDATSSSEASWRRTHSCVTTVLGACVASKEKFVTTSGSGQNCGTSMRDLISGILQSKSAFKRNIIKSSKSKELKSPFSPRFTFQGCEGFLNVMINSHDLIST